MAGTAGINSVIGRL